MASRIFDRVDHSLNAAFAESARHQDSIGMAQARRRSRGRIDFFGFHPLDHRALLVRQSPPCIRASRKLL